MSKILKNTIIHDNVKIGKNVVIHSNCEIGYPHKQNLKTIIGDNCVIRRGSIIYAGCKFGRNCHVGVNAVIREKTVFGDFCSIGTMTQFEGYTEVGNFSRFHTNVHIGQYTTIGNYVWIFPYVVVTNDKYPPYGICPPYKSIKGATIKDYAVISTHSVLMPGITIGKDSIIGACSNVTKDVPDGELWFGNPAEFRRKVEDITLNGKKLYPWRKYYKRELYNLDYENG